jgi:hypothetical protein
LKKDILKLKGVIMILDERKSLIKSYIKKIEVKKIKSDKIGNSRSLGTDVQFGLNNEIEVLNAEIG